MSFRPETLNACKVPLVEAPILDEKNTGIFYKLSAKMLSSENFIKYFKMSGNIAIILSKFSRFLLMPELGKLL